MDEMIEKNKSALILLAIVGVLGYFAYKYIRKSQDKLNKKEIEYPKL